MAGNKSAAIAEVAGRIYSLQSIFSHRNIYKPFARPKPWGVLLTAINQPSLLTVKTGHYELETGQNCGVDHHALKISRTARNIGFASFSHDFNSAYTKHVCDHDNLDISN